MDKMVVRLGLVVWAMTLVLCGGASATGPNSPSWLTDIETNSYVWSTWNATLFQTNFSANPDVKFGSGSATAAVAAGEYGAGLLTGSDFAIGSVDTYIELGKSGQIHLDVTPDSRGMELWIEVLFHEDITAAPQITVSGATRLDGVEAIAENTSLDTATPSQWTSYKFLWKLDAAQVSQFQGIDIVADSRVGSNVAQVSVQTHWVPEPGSLIALASGLVGLAGLKRRRRA